MAMRFKEPHDSRELTDGASGKSQKFKGTVIATDGEDELAVRLFVYSVAPPTYNGLIRGDVHVATVHAGKLYSVEVDYGTTGVGGGDQPTGGADSDGGPPTQPTAPAGPDDPLVSGYSFQVNCPRIHFTRSRVTNATGRGGSDPPDFKGFVGVDKEGRVAGVDFPPDPATTFTRTWARATVTQGYVARLARLAGHPNIATFYGWQPCEVILMSASGQFTQGEGWTITATFGVEEGEVDLEICDGLTVPEKGGWEYLWTRDEEINDGGLVVTVPQAAYVEELLDRVDFGLIEIGE